MDWPTAKKFLTFVAISNLFLILLFGTMSVLVFSFNAFSRFERGQRLQSVEARKASVHQALANKVPADVDEKLLLQQSFEILERYEARIASLEQECH